MTRWTINPKKRHKAVSIHGQHRRSVRLAINEYPRSYGSEDLFEIEVCAMTHGASSFTVATFTPHEARRLAEELIRKADEFPGVAGIDPASQPTPEGELAFEEPIEVALERAKRAALEYGVRVSD